MNIAFSAFLCYFYNVTANICCDKVRGDIMQPKQKLVAGLLGIFLGAWGIHQFYLGDSKKGIIRIIVTVVTCGIGGIWGFIEGIMILCGKIATDAQGNPLA